MANGNGEVWHQGVPVWAKTLVFLVGALGVPVMVSVYFMAMNAGLIGSPQARNEVAIRELDRSFDDHRKSFDDVVRGMRDVVGRRDVWQEKMLHVMVQSCKNFARTEGQIRDCDYWRK